MSSTPEYNETVGGRSYEAPTLEYFGTVHELTHGVASVGFDLANGTNTRP